jgi:hypothetical protein
MQLKTGLSITCYIGPLQTLRKSASKVAPGFVDRWNSGRNSLLHSWHVRSDLIDGPGFRRLHGAVLRRPFSGKSTSLRAT